MRKNKGNKEGWKSNFEPYRGMGKNDQLRDWLISNSLINIAELEKQSNCPKDAIRHFLKDRRIYVSTSLPYVFAPMGFIPHLLQYPLRCIRNSHMMSFTETSFSNALHVSSLLSEDLQKNKSSNPCP
jgi:hypothetical protein